MRKLISFVCILFLSLALFAQNNRSRTTTTQRGSATQQRSSQTRSAQTRSGSTQQRASQTRSTQMQDRSRSSTGSTSSFSKLLQDAVSNPRTVNRNVTTRASSHTVSGTSQNKTSNIENTVPTENAVPNNSKIGELDVNEFLSAFGETNYKKAEEPDMASQPQRCAVSDNEIALVVSGEGQTKNEATASALRSAIEQAFGTFVSANTTLLNDEIVRDEIATVASGNIKSYKELSSIQNADGIYNVSVSAVVSIGKLISYAQSHGSSVEFAGQTFVMNMKMRELNKQNEAVALQNLIAQLKSLQDDIFDFEIQTNEPKQVRDNKHYSQGFYDDDNWDIPITLAIKTNQNYLNFIEILTNTLYALSLSPEEVESYKNNNISCTYVSIEGPNTKNKRIILRNDESVIENTLSSICQILNDAQSSCVISPIGGPRRTKYPLNSNINYCSVKTK